MLSRNACLLLASIVLQAWTPLASAATNNVYGEIDFRGPPADPRVYGAWSTDTYADERTRMDPISFPTETQRGHIDIDLYAGKVAGFQLAESSRGVGDDARTEVEAILMPRVKVVSLSGVSTGARVPLELRVTLNAQFDTPDLITSQTSFALNKLTADLQGQFVFSQSTFAQALYQFDWTRSLGSDTFRHQQWTPAPSSSCPGCLSEVINPNEGLRAIKDVTLRLLLNLEPDTVFHAYLRIGGEAQGRNSSAYGDWLNTAQLGYVLPDGYLLATEEGTPLSAWRIQPVPEPNEFALMLAGLAVMAGVMRRGAARRER